MSNLSVYNGNFIDYSDNEFQFSGSNAKKFSGLRGVSLLDLDVSCNVGVFPASVDEVTIEVDAEDPDDFTIRREGSVLVVKEKNSASGGVSINGINISGGGNMSIINGRIFVDGREVNPNGTSAPAKRQSRIRILAPRNIDLAANLNGQSILASQVVFRKASVKISGQSTIGLAANTLKLRVSGQGESFVVLKGGELNVSLSGQGSVKVKGEYESADVSVSGMGSIETSGICKSDYEASVSGMGRIVNSGVIHGRKRKSVPGMGSVSI